MDVHGITDGDENSTLNKVVKSSQYEHGLGILKIFVVGLIG